MKKECFFRAHDSRIKANFKLYYCFSSVAPQPISLQTPIYDEFEIILNKRLRRILSAIITKKKKKNTRKLCKKKVSTKISRPSPRSSTKKKKKPLTQHITQFLKTFFFAKRSRVFSPIYFLFHAILRL